MGKRRARAKARGTKLILTERVAKENLLENPKVQIEEEELNPNNNPTIAFLFQNSC